MKKIKFLGEEYLAEKIIKRGDSIVGTNKGEQYFLFSGISDFNKYEILDENNNATDYDVVLTENEILMLAITELAELVLGAGV